MKATLPLVFFFCLFTFALTGEGVGGLPAAGRGREQADDLAERFEVVVGELDLAAAELRRDLARARQRRGVGVGEREPHGVPATGARAVARAAREGARLPVEHEH